MASRTRQKHLSELSNLPSDVRITEIISHKNCIEYIAEYDTPEHRICPHCGSTDCRIKDSGYTQSLRHTPSHDQATIVTFHKRRLYCKDCKTSFMENPEWIHPSLRMTLPLYYKICRSLMRAHSLRSIAGMLCISATVVKHVLDTISFDRPEHLPETLCIDEFKGDSGEWLPDRQCWDTNRYHCNIVNGDGQKGYVMDILPDIKADSVKNYFRQFSPDDRKHVKYFCCDMHNGFISVAREIFPQAYICIDMFHIVKRLNKALTDVRLRLQREANACGDYEGYQLLHNSMKTLLLNETAPKNILATSNPKRKDMLAMFSHRFPELVEAYCAVQDFHILRNEPTPVHKRAALIDWINKYAVSSVPEVAKLAQRIYRWRLEIYNTWQFKKSNSPAEGLNDSIKVLKRVAYGHHDFDNFRKRILLCFGPVKLVRKTISISREKADGGYKLKL